MSFNNDNNNFEGNFQSTGANNLRDDYNNMNDRRTGSGLDNDRSFQSNTGTGTGSFNSGFDRTNDRSTGSGINNTESFTNEQARSSYDNNSSGNFGRDGVNSTNSDSNRRDNNLRDNAGLSGRGNDNDAPDTEPREPSGGSAGVMQSSFGAENTTTSTFEKSQGENFGHGFDGSGQKAKEDFGFDDSQEQGRRQNDTGAAAGGSGYSAGQEQGYRNDARGTNDNFATDESTRSSEHSSSHKQGLKEKLVNKAEGKVTSFIV